MDLPSVVGALLRRHVNPLYPESDLFATFGYWKLTGAEAAVQGAGAPIVVDYSYPPLHTYRYQKNTTPGVTLMIPGVQTAVNVAKQQGAGTIQFQDGDDYFLGNYVGGIHKVIDCSGLQNVMFSGSARMVTNTTGTTPPFIFYLADCNNIVFDRTRFFDTGANISVDFQGPWGIYLTTTTANDCGQITLRNVQAQNIIGPITASLFGGGTGRVRGIHTEKLRADGCYYGVNLQEQGDGLTGTAIANNCRRAFYVYGVTGTGKFVQDIWHDAVAPAANSCIIIKRYARDTSGIDARFSFHGSLVWGQLCNFEIQTTTGTAAITAVGAITGGSLYVNGWYANVPLTGGSGTGATALIEISGGAVVNVFINNPGNGYLVGDSLSAVAANLGGAGSGFSFLVGAVGGIISRCNVDIDVSGAPYPDPLVVSNTPFVFQFRAYTQAGVLLTTTPDAWREIALHGNTGDWSFEQPGNGTVQAINVVTKQTGLPGRLSLGGDLFGNWSGTPQVYPGFIVRTSADTDVYTEGGDLTATPLSIDLSQYDQRPCGLGISIHAVADWNSGADQTNLEYILTGSKGAGGVAANFPTQTLVASSTSGVASAVTFATAGNALTAAFTNYNGARAYLKLAVQHRGRFT